VAKKKDEKKMTIMGSWKEAAVHLLWLKDVVTILLPGFEENLIYQLTLQNDNEVQPV